MKCQIPFSGKNKKEKKFHMTSGMTFEQFIKGKTFTHPMPKG